METLNLLIQKAVTLNLWEGIDVGDGGSTLTHLQYADDTILFYPPNIEYLLNIKKALILFQLASGSQVHFHKSPLIGIHIEDNWLQKTADCLLYKIGHLPFTYLGLPIGVNSSPLKFWNLIIEHMNKRLATWKGKLLSIAGQLTLIKASLSSLLLYFMSLFPMPKGVIDKINKIQRQFLWAEK